MGSGRIVWRGAVPGSRICSCAVQGTFLQRVRIPHNNCRSGWKQPWRIMEVTI